MRTQLTKENTMAKIKVEVIAFEGLDITLIEEYLDGIINGATGLSEPLTDTFHLDRDIDSLVQSAIVSSTNLHLETADSVVAYVQLD